MKALQYCFGIVVFTSAAVCWAAEPVLKDVFADRFLIGAAISKNQSDGQAPHDLAIVSKHYNTITPENILKWEAVHPKPDTYNFEPVDRLVAWGEKHNMFIVGHTLLWHQQTPAWVFEDAQGKPLNREALLKRLKDHIDAVMGRYKGRIGGWDVVNEAIEDDGSLRKTQWLEISGPDYIEKAFEYARAADPEAELYYNDYNMFKPGRRMAVVKLVQSLQEKNIRIDGIGLQGHWGLDYPSMQELTDSLRAFGATHVPVMITEMDLTVLPKASRQQGADIALNVQMREELNPYRDGLPDAMQTKLADRYGELFRVLVNPEYNVRRVTFWGVQDGNSWRNYWPVRGRTDYPLLFDRQGKPKPAFDAVVGAAGK
jgi:endo-1,4-beta-xylanase